MISRAQTHDRPTRPTAAESGRTTTTRPVPKKDDSLQIRPVTSFSGLRRLAAQWEALQLSSSTTNPFTNPAWVLAWAEHLIEERDLFVLTAWRGEDLVGVAPFYWITLGPLGRHAVRSLHLMGNGRSSQFTEIPGILVQRGEHRAVLGALASFLQSEVPRWDWVKLTVDAPQGWFEPQWLEKTTRAHSPFVVHHATRACVVLDLPDTWESFLGARKRNVRESIRRSFNRMDKQVGEWSVETPKGRRDLCDSVQRIIELHEARAELAGKPKHPSMFAGGAAVPFYSDAVVAMAERDQAEVSILRFKDEPVAGLITLRSGDRVFTSVTGADPAAWDFGPGTILISELARREIARGTASINLSTGPNQSKLRWSERLEFNHDFVIVGPTRSARTRFALFSQASNLVTVNRMKDWNTYD